jgi:hypothetical protein
VNIEHDAKNVATAHRAQKKLATKRRQLSISDREQISTVGLFVKHLINGDRVRRLDQFLNRRPLPARLDIQLGIAKYGIAADACFCTG